MSPRAARDLCLGLLSLHAVAHALFAWDAATVGRPWLVLPWGVAIASALLAGERLEGRLSAAGEWLGSGRFRIVLVLGFSAATVLAPVAMLADPELVAVVVRGFALLQLALLLLAASDAVVGALLVNAATLAVLAALRGGAVAAGAIVGWLAWLAAFLAFDRFARTLLAYPRARPPALALPLRLALARLLPPALLVAACLALFPAPPYQRVLDRAPASLTALGPGTTIAYNVLTLVAIMASAGLLALLRLLGKRQPGPPPAIDVVELEEMAEEDAPRIGADAGGAPSGTRGRIVRAYFRFLDAAERHVARRRPSQTPREIARLVGEPAGPLARLTALFSGARWGPDDPSEADARAAEGASAAAVAGLRQRRGVDAGRGGG